MALLSWDPFRDMDNFVDRYLQPHQSRQWLPAVDIDEDDKAFHLALEVPGMSKEQINVAVHNGLLTVSGERSRQDKGTNHRTERRYGSFSRTFSLPEGVDTDAIEARFDSGLLILALPKSTTPDEPRRIEVQ